MSVCCTQCCILYFVKKICIHFSMTSLDMLYFIYEKIKYGVDMMDGYKGWWEAVITQITLCYARKIDVNVGYMTVVWYWAWIWFCCCSIMSGKIGKKVREMSGKCQGISTGLTCGNPFYVTSSYSIWIFCRGVSGFATDCTCDVRCRGLTTCLLHVGPPFGNHF